jgi:hypothetical protein
MADQIICLNGNTNSIQANGTKSEVVQQLKAHISTLSNKEGVDTATSFFEGIVNVLESNEANDTSRREKFDNDVIDEPCRPGGVFGVETLNSGGPNIVDIETKQDGEVSIATYWYYLTACGGWPAAIGLVFACLWISFAGYVVLLLNSSMTTQLPIVYLSFRLFQNYSLGLWMEEMETSGSSGFAFDRYLLSVVGVVLAFAFRLVMQMLWGFGAAQVWFF